MFYCLNVDTRFLQAIAIFPCINRLQSIDKLADIQIAISFSVGPIYLSLEHLQLTLWTVGTVWGPAIPGLCAAQAQFKSGPAEMVNASRDGVPQIFIVLSLRCARLRTEGVHSRNHGLPLQTMVFAQFVMCLFQAQTALNSTNMRGTPAPAESIVAGYPSTGFLVPETQLHITAHNVTVSGNTMGS